MEKRNFEFVKSLTCTKINSILIVLVCDQFNIISCYNFVILQTLPYVLNIILIICLICPTKGILHPLYQDQDPLRFSPIGQG